MIRVLTVADLHQKQKHYGSLARAVSKHQPDVVAIVGDWLDIGRERDRDQFSIESCADLLSGLPTRHVVFVRGNHEDLNWPDFIHAWPLKKRPLVALCGTVFTVGPLAMVGFPCHQGLEEAWCQTLPKAGNEVTADHTLSGRSCLPLDPESWLAPLLRRVGVGARTLWLMHEPPIARPLAHPLSCNPAWTGAVESFRPLLVVSGHDHLMPLRNNTWHAKLGDSVCVNVGQNTSDLHYCVLDFEFQQEQPGLPTNVTVQAFPWRQQIKIRPA